MAYVLIGIAVKPCAIPFEERNSMSISYIFAMAPKYSNKPTDTIGTIEVIKKTVYTLYASITKRNLSQTYVIGVCCSDVVEVFL